MWQIKTVEVTSKTMENWCNNTNLQEKGEKNQPTNYRGITLTSCLEKLFTSLLGNRLVTFLETQNIINTHQFGFRSNSRTAYSIFVLQQLIHKAFTEREKLYVAFIDY